MKILYYVITDCGDGSNSIDWVTDEAVIEKMQRLADSGEGSYASGDGLQLRELKFPEDFNLTEWLKLNHISLTTLEDLAWLEDDEDAL